MPDLTVFFDINPEEGLARIAENEKREENRLDNESINFHQKVYEGYQELIRRYPERISNNRCIAFERASNGKCLENHMLPTHLIVRFMI